ncbi:MAG: hypothetical protein RL536_521 [Candidatus Parcubacteria bacterium]|jgi:DNA repair protein RecO
MYTITTTPGFIIESRPSGETGKLLSIFTRDLGLVLASAQGIRMEKSKLRYHAQDYSFGRFSFVKGKEFWRLTNAEEVARRDLARGTRSRLALTSRIALILRRLLHGEEANPELFDQIQSTTDFLIDSPDLNTEQLHNLESIIVYRILYLLGYIGTDKKVGTQFVFDQMSLKLIDDASKERQLLNQHINKALRESHL